MDHNPSAIVILGASGDLAKRKLIPALARLYEKGDISSDTAVIGSGRSEFTDDEFRSRFDVCAAFRKNLHYHAGIPGLKSFVDSRGTFAKTVVFLSLPPKVYAETARELAEEGFGPETTLIIEKPFGYDYAPSKQLNNDLHEVYDERQLFRIDHYLAKEAVQNILVFRFANSLFSSVWNCRYIDSIQINAQESIGVEDRGAYFDGSGTIRDMIQNHLMQLLSLLAMEPPVSLEADEVRQQKLNLLKALRIKGVHRAQYDGYHDEKGVIEDSTTETYAEISLEIDNFRWSGVPIYIRAGKELGRKGTEIAVNFKPLPKLLFNAGGTLPPNRIIFKIQPSEGIVVELASKIPGNTIEVTTTNLTFCYAQSFDVEIPEAYQRLLLDAIKGEGTLFVSAAETEVAWRKIDPFVGSGEVEIYEPGSPPASRFGVEWIDFDSYETECP